MVLIHYNGYDSKSSVTCILLYWVIFSFFTALLLNQGKIGLGLKVQCAALIPTYYCQIEHMLEFKVMNQWVHFAVKRLKKPYCFLLQRGFCCFLFTLQYYDSVLLTEEHKHVFSFSLLLIGLRILYLIFPGCVTPPTSSANDIIIYFESWIGRARYKALIGHWVCEKNLPGTIKGNQKEWNVFFSTPTPCFNRKNTK